MLSQVSKGECRLELSAGQLVRRLRVVNVFIVRDNGQVCNLRKRVSGVLYGIFDCCKMREGRRQNFQ